MKLFGICAQNLLLNTHVLVDQYDLPKKIFSDGAKKPLYQAKKGAKMGNFLASSALVQHDEKGGLGQVKLFVHWHSNAMVDQIHAC